MNLKNIRKFMKFTQQDITDLFRIPRRTFQDWELGNRKCPEWCKRLVIEKMLNYKGDGYVTIYKIDDITGDENQTLYLGAVYDEAIATYEQAYINIKNSIDCEYPDTFIEAKIYRVPQEIDINNTTSITDAISKYSGYSFTL